MLVVRCSIEKPRARMFESDLDVGIRVENDDRFAERHVVREEIDLDVEGIGEMRGVRMKVEIVVVKSAPRNQALRL